MQQNDSRHPAALTEPWLVPTDRPDPACLDTPAVGRQPSVERVTPSHSDLDAQITRVIGLLYGFSTQSGKTKPVPHPSVLRHCIKGS